MQVHKVQIEAHGWRNKRWKQNHEEKSRRSNFDESMNVTKILNEGGVDADIIAETSASDEHQAFS